MLPADISTRTLKAAIAALHSLPLPATMALELKGWLRYQLATLEHPRRIQFTPHPTDETIWLIDGQPYRAPRGTKTVWAFWMALRDGEAQAEWVRPTGTIRNARSRIVRWLEGIGHRELAAEVLSVETSNCGRMIYRRKKHAPEIFFDI